jgi:hypothetical protein
MHKVPQTVHAAAGKAVKTNVRLSPSMSLFLLPTCTPPSLCHPSQVMRAVQVGFATRHASPRLTRAA